MLDYLFVEFDHDKVCLILDTHCLETHFDDCDEDDSGDEPFFEVGAADVDHWATTFLFLVNDIVLLFSLVKDDDRDDIDDASMFQFLSLPIHLLPDFLYDFH